MNFISKDDKPKYVFNDHPILLEAQRGNEQARNEFINKYKPFIINTASKMTGRYLNPGDDDEFSVALIAFNEAIDKYDNEKGSSFISFAETVIKRRLIDYFRKETNYKNVIPISSLQYDDETEERLINQIEAEKSQFEFQKKVQGDELKEEIISYQKVLNEFDISFSILSQVSPKHEDARLRAMEVAKIVSQNNSMKNHLLTKKELPIKAILEQVNISRKTLERQRKYIIAIILILVNNYNYLRGYIKNL